MIVDPTAISSALRNQIAIPDSRFDRLFPTRQRVRSSFHWTPVEIALRASSLLAQAPASRVLDVGCGVGKVCLVGALATTATWVGIERDFEMVGAAEQAARKLGVARRVQFVHGDATAIDWTSFDAIYLFNPFAETLLGSEVDALTRRERYVQLVEQAQHQLASTRPGTRIVTYHGFGGDMPDVFELVHREPAREDQLCLWIRRPRSSRLRA